MQPDSQFVDNYVAAVQDEQSADLHDDWVELQLAQDFMRNARAAMCAGAVVSCITLALLFGHVHAWGLTLWAVLTCSALIYRYHTLRKFDRLARFNAPHAPLPDVAGFFKQHGWSWPASAVVFAFPVFLHYEHAPLVNQYLCMMILIGLGAVGASLMAAHLRCQQQFSHALCATGLASIFVHSVQEWPVWPAPSTWVLSLLMLLFWVLIVYLGRHLHTLQRSSYSAQFGNEQLIRSLRQQTLAATQAVQMKNNLLASATHDLRQPVHALAFYADWLRNEPDLAASVIPKILAATDSVNTLFNSLFDFARIESGAIQIKWGDVDIHALIEEMAVQFAPAADAKGLSLTIDSRPIRVRSDPVLLRRITANLLANAIRYTDKGGVKLQARLVDDKLWLEISDSGCGIAPEHLPHVFKEFYRAPVHAGTADSFGLGLAIVQRLCRALGHVVTLRSVIGKGTRCRLELPLANKEPQDTPSKPMALDDAQKMYAQMRPRERAQ